MATILKQRILNNRFVEGRNLNAMVCTESPHAKIQCPYQRKKNGVTIRKDKNDSRYHYYECSYKAKTWKDSIYCSTPAFYAEMNKEK